MYAVTPGSNQSSRDCTDRLAVPTGSAAQKLVGEERAIGALDFSEIDKTCTSSSGAAPKPLLPSINRVVDNVGSPLLHSTDVSMSILTRH